MRAARLKVPAHAPAGYYHCLSRVVDRRFILGEVEKERFVSLLREHEAFCEVRTERGQFLLLTTGGWVRERADASKSGLNQWRSELCRGLNPKLNLQLNLPIPMIGNADARCSRIWD